MNIHEQIKQGPRRARKAIDVCLKLDLVSRWEELSEQLAHEQGERKLADKKNPVVSEMDALVQEMGESTYTLTLEELPRERWQELGADHPPRDGNAEDRKLGVNASTFFAVAIPESLVDPELDDEEKTALLAMLHQSQFNELAGAILHLNRGRVDIPKPSSAWRTPESTGETSTRLSGSASRTNGSAGGSRKKSSSTSTTTKGASSGR